MMDRRAKVVDGNVKMMDRVAKIVDRKAKMMDRAIKVKDSPFKPYINRISNKKKTSQI